MQCSSSAMTYVVLRGMRNDAQGSARMETQPEGLQLLVCAEGLLSSEPLRMLLLSIGSEGAALDLGRVEVSPEGRVQLTRMYPPVDLQLWDAIALVEDWPSGQLAAAGWLSTSAAPVWRLAEAAAQFLRVPAE